MVRAPGSHQRQDLSTHSKHLLRLVSMLMHTSIREALAFIVRRPARHFHAELVPPWAGRGQGTPVGVHPLLKDAGLGHPQREGEQGFNIRI